MRSLLSLCTRSSLTMLHDHAQTEWEDTAAEGDVDAGLSSPRLDSVASTGGGAAQGRKGDENDALGLMRGGVLA